MKKCDLCRKRPATHKINRIDENGQMVELNLCEECAKTKGIIGPKELKTLLQILAELKKKIIEEDTQLVCPKCQMTFANFKALGKLGCEECYTAFQEKLLPIIQELHHSTHHTGKVPKEETKRKDLSLIKKLRQELKKAIEKEDYEKAAAIRDTLKKYETENE
ncbi:MAG: UvrB/UvrC motif-containing protein [candidate division WOR-3 bacterium]